MKTVIAILLITLALPPLAMSSPPLTIELAVGVSSRHSPLSHKWCGRVGESGLYFRERALRIGYSPDSKLSFSVAAGLLDRWDMIESYFIETDPYGIIFTRQDNRNRVYYFAPALEFSALFLNLELGAILYDTNQEHPEQLDRPFDKRSGAVPTIKIGLGEENIHFYAGYLSSFPLYTGGELEIGIEGLTADAYEHRIYVGQSYYEDISVGYRGEFGFYRQTAISLGIRLGGVDNGDVYTLSLGLKTKLPLR